MKVILTGSTGLIGSGVLRRCIEHPDITSIVALTRRPLEDVQNPKVNNIIHKDFHNYDNEVVNQLKGAQACIWVLGSPTGGKEVHVDYTHAALKMIQTSLLPQVESGKPFRFVYTSGGLVPWLDSNVLFFLGNARKARGDMDREVLALEEQNKGRWESFVVRPWRVVDAEPALSKTLPNSWIFRKELAAAMVDSALNGGEPRLLDNAGLVAKGKAALKQDH